MEKQPVLFHIGDVLTVSTGGKLFCLRERPPLPNGDIPEVRDHPMSGVYEILSHLTNNNVETTDIPRAINEAQPVMLERHPFLRDIEWPGIPDGILGEEREKFASDWLRALTTRLHEAHPDLVSETGYIAVSPLKFYARRTAEENIEYFSPGSSNKIVGAFTNKGSFRRRLFENTSTEEIARIPQNDHPEVAQSLLSLGNIDVMEFMVSPEQIYHAEGVINLKTSTSNPDEADRTFRKVESYFKEAELDNYVSLEFDTSNGGMEYVVQVAAARLEADGKTNQLVDFVRSKTSRRDHASDDLKSKGLIGDKGDFSPPQ